MPVPWLQIVQLVPSIVDVSRELLKRSKQMAPPSEGAVPQSADDLAARVLALQENERRQAELISQMAEQMAGLTRAVTELHRRVIWLGAGIAVALLLAIIAAVIAFRS